MRHRYYILTILICLLSSAFAQEALQYSAHHYSVSDGLSQNTVMSILQDRDGFVWIGTWDGLNRFDGHHFRTYKPTLSGRYIASNRIDLLYEDSIGFIWMRTYDGSFYRLNKHTDCILPTDLRDTRSGTHLPGKHLILEQAKGVMWLSGDNKLVRITETDEAGHTDETTQQTYNLHGEANFLLSDSHHHLWAGTSAGLECVADGAQSCYCPGSSPQDNNFTCGITDATGLWLGTESGCVWRYADGHNRFEPITTSLGAPVTALAMLDAHTLIILTDGNGFYTYDSFSNSLQCYNSTTTHGKIQSDHFSDIYVDRSGSAWFINQEQGVWRFNLRGNNLHRYTIAIDERFSNQLDRNFFAFEDHQGLLWLNPNGGGFSVYDPRKDQLISPLGGVSNMIHAAYIDRKGSLWLGTYELGLDRVDVEPKSFRLSDLRLDSKHSGELRAIIQLRDSNIIAATKDGTIRVYDNHDQLMQTTELHSRVYSMLEGPDGDIIFGTKGNGIIRWHDGQRMHYLHSDHNRSSLLCDDVYDLLIDTDSNLWVATYGGGINILRNGEFIHQSNGWDNYPNDFGAKVRQMAFIDDSTLWAATTDCLLRINTRTLATQVVPYCDVRCIYPATDGHVWVGTFGGGLIEVLDPYAEDLLASGNIHLFDSRGDLLSDIVLSIVGDQAGNIWFTSEETLSHYDVHTGTFQHFKALSEMPRAAFSEAEGRLLANGEICFGTTFGGCIFSPERIFRDDDDPQIIFTDLTILGSPATIGPDGHIADNICYRPEIRLHHDENLFTIEFAALDYRHQSEIQYAYKLEGVDQDWVYVEHTNHATYTRLSPGDYTFHVRSTNAQGIWCDNEQTLHIHVDRSFWVSPGAWLIYLLLLLCIVYLIVHYISANSRLRQEVEIEQKVTDIKLRFFTNISHELRTPLTLISGPVENVLRDDHLTPAVRTQLEIVSSNAARMLRLINQILDFRKIQNKKMKLRVQSVDIAKLAEETAGNFRKEAGDKHIDFRVENQASNPIAWIDRDKVDTIIYNLLSNAFKFTPAGQSITVLISEKKDFVLISVKDTGIGIPKDKRSVLFERFASHNEIHTASDKPGTGIGLNLVKEIVDLMHGYIEVESEPGKGTTFTVMLHRDKDHFDSTVEVVVDDLHTLAQDEETTESAQDNEQQIDPNLKTILVVDDNDDMRIFLRNILCTYYNVLTATDGVEALDLATSDDNSGHNIDLVITDLMMPNLDGLELTNQLKSDMRTSHIPVILLTAKTAIESRLEALQYGADDYITKPFSPEYLLARVDNILRQHERLRETFRAAFIQPETAAVEEETPMSPNDIFLQRLYDFMLRNIDNNELTVDDLVHEMALGRTVFFNKLKGLTGLSPVEYIRDVRIKQAAKLLLDDRYNITEVTYMVGMNDSRYFAKCFKAVYGITPTEYKRNNNKS